ncbi:MAG: NUDIX hydrolase, partial [Pseudomonadota bacterium]
MAEKMLGSAYDKEDEGDVVERGRPSPRPKDAATLILLRRDESQPRILMGKRSGKHAFMPDKYVFPGGRVDPQDGKAPSLTELHPKTAAKLQIKCRRTPRSFALTAIRETFEETGLIVGKARDIGGARPEGWGDYYALGAAPCL